MFQTDIVVGGIVINFVIVNVFSRMFMIAAAIVADGVVDIATYVCGEAVCCLLSIR